MGERVISRQSEAVLHLCAADPAVAEAVSLVGDLTYVTYDDAFSFLAETIVGQMLSSRVADVLCKRLYALAYGALTPAAVAALSLEQLRGIGLSGAKAGAILGLAAAIGADPARFDRLRGQPDAEIVDALTALRGIGAWTAKMALIFLYERPNVLPFEDGAFVQAYRWLYRTDEVKPASIAARCAYWSPHASIGARYLYRLLDMGFTKTERVTR